MAILSVKLKSRALKTFKAQGYLTEDDICNLFLYCDIPLDEQELELFQTFCEENKIEVIKKKPSSTPLDAVVTHLQESYEMEKTLYFSEIEAVLAKKEFSHIQLMDVIIALTEKSIPVEQGVKPLNLKREEQATEQCQRELPLDSESNESNDTTTTYSHPPHHAEIHTSDTIHTSQSTLALVDILATIYRKEKKIHLHTLHGLLHSPAYSSIDPLELIIQLTKNKLSLTLDEIYDKKILTEVRTHHKIVTKTVINEYPYPAIKTAVSLAFSEQILRIAFIFSLATIIYLIRAS